MHIRLGVSRTPGILSTRSCEATGALPRAGWDLSRHQQGSPLHTMYSISLESLGLNGIRIHLHGQSAQYSKPVFGGLHLAAPAELGVKECHLIVPPISLSTCSQRLKHSNH